MKYKANFYWGIVTAIGTIVWFAVGLWIVGLVWLGVTAFNAWAVWNLNYRYK